MRKTRIFTAILLLFCASLALSSCVIYDEGPHYHHHDGWWRYR